MSRETLLSLVIMGTMWMVPQVATFAGNESPQSPRSMAKEPGAVKVVPNSASVQGKPEVATRLPTPRKPEGELAARRAAARQLIAAAVRESENISDAEPRSVVLLDIATAQVKAGDVLAAKATAAEIENWKDEIYQRIAQAEATRGDLADANATKALIGNEYVKGEVDRAIVSVQVKKGDLVGASSTAAQIVCKDADGLDALSELRARACIEIAEAKVKSGDKAGAVTPLEAAAAAAATTTPTPSIELLLEVAAAQIKAGDTRGAGETLRMAREAARLLVGDKSKPGAYHAVFEAQVLAGDAAGAKAAAAEVTERFNSQIDLKLVAYKGIAEGQAKMGDVVGAKATAEGIDDEHERASAFSGIAYVQAKAGDLDGAKVTAALIGVKYEREWACCTIAEAQAEAGDIAGAKATAATINEGFPKLECYCAIARAQMKVGDIAVARETFDAANALAADIKDERHKLSAYSRIADARLKVGDWEGAKATAAQFSRAAWREPVYRKIAEMQAKAGNLAAARETMEMAVKTAAEPSDESRALLYCDIAKAQAKFGDVKEAKLNAAKIEEKLYQQQANVAIIVAQAKGGDVAGAIEFSMRASNVPLGRCVSLTNAAEELCAESNEQKAELEEE